MLAQFILGMLLFAPSFYQAPEPKSEEAIEEQVEPHLDEEVIQRQVEQNINRIMGQVNPSEWKGVAVLGVLVPISSFGLVAFVVWMLVRNSQAKRRAWTEFHKQLLDKFASGGEFAQFLDTKGGQRLLEGLWSQQVNAKERILRSMRGGVVLTILGLGTLGLSYAGHHLLVPGVLILALGIGFLVSTAISYRLSNKLGLLRDKADDSESTPMPQ